MKITSRRPHPIPIGLTLVLTLAACGRPPIHVVHLDMKEVILIFLDLSRAASDSLYFTNAFH
jgi:hypothetical protein